MTYLEAIGHMVVIDKNTGKIKFFQARGYGFRNEEIGSLLRGKSFLEKRSDGENSDLCPQIGRRMEELFEGDRFISDIKMLLEGENGQGTKKSITSISAPCIVIW